MGTITGLGEQIRAPTDTLTLWWLGNGSFAVRYGEAFILIDPVCMPLGERDPLRAEVGGRLLRPFPILATEIQQLDAILITHDHGDHAGPLTLAELKGLEPLVVGPGSLPALLHKKYALGMDSSRLRVVVPGERVRVGGISIESVRAIHGGLNGGVPWPVELGSGYLLRAGGCSVFHPGDSVLLEDHYRLQDIDVLLLPICTHSHTLRALPDLLSPAVVIPMHYGTYEVTDANRHWTHGDPEEVRAALDHPERLVLLEQGEAFRVSS
jgi:L-ascorbate metabolism protein UlaG (beta-lactamase superfamily)